MFNLLCLVRSKRLDACLQSLPRARLEPKRRACQDEIQVTKVGRCAVGNWSTAQGLLLLYKSRQGDIAHQVEEKW